MSVRFLLFDLDQTLYPRDAGVMQNIGRQIQRYLEEHLGYSPGEASALRHRYFVQYGTTMRGLILHQAIDADHYLRYVHDFPLNGLLAADPQLDAMLAALPCEKVIFTNADRAHAERVLARLAVRRHFSRIVDVVAVNYVSKPAPEAYVSCLRLLDAAPTECVLIEDSARNLAPAAALGITTVLVDGDARAQADYHVDHILDLPPVITAICQARGC